MNTLQAEKVQQQPIDSRSNQQQIAKLKFPCFTTNFRLSRLENCLILFLFFTCFLEHVAKVADSFVLFSKRKGTGIETSPIHCSNFSRHRFDHHPDRHTRWITMRIENNVRHHSGFCERHVFGWVQEAAEFPFARVDWRTCHQHAEASAVKKFMCADYDNRNTTNQEALRTFDASVRMTFNETQFSRNPTDRSRSSLVFIQDAVNKTCETFLFYTLVNGKISIK